MRVTDQRLFEDAARGAAAARERHAQAAREVSSGLRVEHPEDDPAAAGLVATHLAQASRDGAIAKALGTARDELDAADQALDGVGNALSRARELAVQLANGTWNAQDRANAAPEVEALFSQVLGLVNTKFGHRYLFGGNLDQTPPFDAAGTWVGDAGVRQAELAPGVWIDASIRADVGIGGVGGGVDVLATLGALAQALASDNVAGVQSALGALDQAITQVASARASGGAQASVISVAAEAARASRDGHETARSTLADADVIDSASRLALAERALEAALTAAAKSFRPTLLDEL